jgi:hypothetical protein
MLISQTNFQSISFTHNCKRETSSLLNFVHHNISLHRRHNCHCAIECTTQLHQHRFNTKEPIRMHYRDWEIKKDTQQTPWASASPLSWARESHPRHWWALSSMAVRSPNTWTAARRPALEWHYGRRGFQWRWHVAQHLNGAADIANSSGGGAWTWILGAATLGVGGEMQPRLIRRGGVLVGNVQRLVGGASGWLRANSAQLSLRPSDLDPTLQIGVYIVCTGKLVSTWYTPFYKSNFG